MPSIFTRIINGDIPSHKVAEDDRYFAFLDINPLQQGHTLVVPKVEVDRLFDLDDVVLEGILPFAGKVAKKIKAVIPCDRIGLAVIGLEVPHAHIHLIPINSERDMDFSGPKLRLTQDQLAAIAEQMRNA